MCVSVWVCTYVLFNKSEYVVFIVPSCGIVLSCVGGVRCAVRGSGVFCVVRGCGGGVHGCCSGCGGGVRGAVAVSF